MSEKHTKPPLTIYGMVFSNGQAGGSSAIEDVEGRKTTYKQLNEQVFSIVGILNSVGYKRNDRIAIALPTGPEMAVAIIAFSCGFSTVPLNPNQTQSECERDMSEVHAKALIVEDGSKLAAVKAAKDLGMELISLVKCPERGAGIFSLGGLDGCAESEAVLARPDDIANILFTSGTTLKPKIVPWSHSMICWGQYYNLKSLPGFPSDRYLILNPLFHAAGLNNIYRPLCSGGTIICTPGFQRSEFFSWLDNTRPTVYSAPPVAQQSIIEMAKENMDIISRSNLRIIRVGTAALPMKILKEVERIFKLPILETYSSTEVIGIGRSSADFGHKPGVLKIVSPEIEIMDENGKLLSKGQMGEIAVRGPNVFKGYENDPEANSASFVDGWFRTGDLGYIDKEGYIHLEGRVKDVINKGGEKVAPQEIDNALMEHPAVAEAVAFPVPHATLGEDIAAAVVLREGCQISEKDLRSHLFNRLAYYKVPTRIVFVKDIPKKAIGKVNRLEVAKELGF